MTKKIVIVNGAPGAGKTTLTNLIRMHTDITVIEKDAIKEFYFEYLGVGDREWSRALGKASIDAMFSLASQLLGIEDVLLMETAFYADIAKKDFAKLSESHDIEFLEVYCQVDESERRRRFESRASSGRHPGHADLIAPTEAQDNIDRYVPMNIGEYVEVSTDTFSESDAKNLIERIKSFIGGNV